MTNTFFRNYFLALNSTLAVLGIIGNSCVLACIARKGFEGQDVHHRFLVNFVCGELYLSLISGISYMVQLIKQNAIVLTCIRHLIRNLELVGYFGSLLGICALSVDHYISIVHPNQYQKFVKAFGLRTIAAIWVIAVVLAFVDYPAILIIFMNKPKTTTIATYAQVDNPTGYGTSCDIMTDQLAARLAAGDYDEMNIMDSLFDIDGPCFVNETKKETELQFNLIDEVLTLVNGNKEVGFCAFYSAQKLWVELIVAMFSFAGLLFLAVCYGRMLVTSYRAMQSNQRKLRIKLLVTTVYFIGAFALCYIPFMAFEVALGIQYYRKMKQSATNEQETHIAASLSVYLFIQHALSSLMMLYPFLASIIYVARSKLFKRYAMEALNRLPCFCFDQATTPNSSTNGFVPVDRQPREANTVLEAEATV